MRVIRSILTVFSVALLIGPAGAQIVDPVPSKYHIYPENAAADKPFVLTTLNPDIPCNVAFYDQTVSVNGGRIDLTFRDSVRALPPGVLCPSERGPDFTVPALKAGHYQVYVAFLITCPKGLMCLPVVIPNYAGTLNVGAAYRKGWFLKEKQTLADKPFAMQLLNNDYGNCGISFTHKTVNELSNSINVSFLVEKESVQCIVDIHPNGPAFDMGALKAGAYPIYVDQLLACEVTPPYCQIKKLPPVVSDTLIVTQTLSILLSGLEAHAPAVEMHGSRAAFRLPQGGGGIWQAELLALSGRRLSTAPLKGASGDRVELDLGPGLKTGVYLLRLRAPDGETHMLPILRKM